MENKRLLQKLNRLEEELESLREIIEPPENNPLKKRLKGISKFLIAYWPLVSLVSAVVIGFIAYIFYGVSPMENYRAVQANKVLSRTYDKLGDALLYKNQWDEAELAYQKAVEINKNDVHAALGIYKADVFKTLPDQKYFVPEVVLTKLKVLEKQHPNDYQIAYLRGEYYSSMGYYKESIPWFTQSIRKAGWHLIRFAPGYIARGKMKEITSDMAAACWDFRLASLLDPESSVANDNVGVCKVLKGDLRGAVRFLYTSTGNSADLVSYVDYGDALLSTGSKAEALYQLQWVSQIIDDPEAGDKNNNFIAGDWLFHYLPPYQGDKTMNDYVLAKDLISKKIFIHYNLSFGYILNGKKNLADSEFISAHRMDESKQYSDYFKKKMQSLSTLVPDDSQAQEWFATCEAILAREK